MNANIAARLIERAGTHPERTAIVEYAGSEARRVSFGDLAARVARTGAGMRAAGVGPGSRVLIFVPMSIDLYVTLLGAMHVGATVVLMDAWADRRRLDAAVRVARPDLFVGSPRAHLLRLVSPAVRAIPRHWVAGRRWLRLARHERPAEKAAVVAGDTPALVTFTTGSTGTPKAAARSHAFLWAQHEALARHLGLTEADVDMPTLPVFVLNNLALGVPSVLPDFDPRRPADIDPERIHRQMAAEKVTTTSGSPAFYDRLLAWAEARRLRLGLRALWTGGAPVYPNLARRLQGGVGGQAHVVYGSTEAEPIAGIEVEEMLRAMESLGWRGGICCGTPVPQIEVKLLRPVDGPIELGPKGWTEWEAEPAEPGEIVVAGPHVLGEYMDAPEETRRHKIRDGVRVWHRTGDAGWMDAGGRLWLVGRVGSRVERAGRTWWSTPAEARATQVPGVVHAAYLGVSDPLLGQRALLVVEAPPEAAGGALDTLLRAALSPVPVDEVRIVERIPRDPRHASKTDTAALLRQLGRVAPG